MEYPQYNYPVGALHVGSSLGNMHAFARFDRESNLRGLWSAADNEFYAGAWMTGVSVGGKPAHAVETQFAPESQATTFERDGVRIEKQAVLPYACGGGDGQRMRALLLLLRIQNGSGHRADVALRQTIVFPADPCDLFTKQPPLAESNKTVLIRERDGYVEIVTAGREAEARIFGGRFDACRHDDRSLTVEYRLTIEPHGETLLEYVLAFSPSGVEEALSGYRACSDGRSLAESRRAYGSLLSRSFLFTPDRVINRALQWAKVNTVRVQHRYRAGEGFTNDPPQDIVVMRDLAWYVLGADYLTEEFSGGLLDLARRCGVEEGGKVTEYIHASEAEPVRHDYNLNINDDTPLLVYALYHHAVTCGGGWDAAYPLMKGACDWIVSQVSGGLVRCHASGTSVWGICGWRNIIDDYNLTGAVTEINAECYHALKLTSMVASHLRLEADYERYASGAQNLLAAIHRDLVSERTGMYLLNLGNDGIPHDDITGDLIFPVLFDLSPPAMRQKILEVLTSEEMWTPFGSRTVSPREKYYDPDAGYQLVGGLWHNLTAWIGYSIRTEQPERLVEGMRNIYRLSDTAHPVDYDNVVPGQFPERLHGRTYRSRGMTMSPWMPPTYLWLGIEGLLGVKATLDEIRMDPCLPRDWEWAAVKNLRIRGTSLDAFVHRGTLHTTMPVASRLPVKTGTRFETACDNDLLFSLGMTIDGVDIVFVASDRDAEGTVTFPGGSKRVHLSSGTSMLISSNAGGNL